MPSGMPDEFDLAMPPIGVALPIGQLIEAGATEARAAAAVFRSLGHPIRLQILSLLARCGTLTRSGLANLTGTTWSTLENHLTVLDRDGLITASGTGRATTYTLTAGLQDVLTGLVELTGETS